MRTTIRMESDVLRRAKTAAAAAGVSLTKFIEDAVRKQLDPPMLSDIERPPIPTFAGDGVRQGVDLTNNRAIRDLMDRLDEDS